MSPVQKNHNFHFTCHTHSHWMSGKYIKNGNCREFTILSQYTQLQHNRPRQWEHCSLYSISFRISSFMYGVVRLVALGLPEKLTFHFMKYKNRILCCRIVIGVRSNVYLISVFFVVLSIPISLYVSAILIKVTLHCIYIDFMCCGSCSRRVGATIQQSQWQYSFQAFNLWWRQQR